MAKEYTQCQLDSSLSGLKRAEIWKAETEVKKVELVIAWCKLYLESHQLELVK